MGIFTAKRVHGPGNGDVVEIIITGERICGAGHFSNVFCATLESPAKMKVAVKNAWVSKDDRGKFDVYPEVAILSMIKHPNCVDLLYHFTKPTEKEICYSLVLEYLPIEVGKYLKEGKSFDLLDVKLYSWQVFCALDYLSAYDIAHLDIKPSNILIDDEAGLLKLTDFGNAKVLANDVDYLPYQVTRFYRAPELLFGCLRYTTTIDVWAAGCVTAELLTGKPIFRAKNQKDQSRLLVDIFGYPTDEEVKAMKVGRPRVRRGNNIGLEKHCPELPTDMVAMLNKIFVYNIKTRLTASEVMYHSFYSDLKNLPTRRNGNKVPDLGFDIDEQKTLDSELCNSFFELCPPPSMPMPTRKASSLSSSQN